MVIAGIEGILKSRGDDWVIIDVGGVSFRLQAPTSTLSMLGPPGDRVQLHTHLQVREESLALYGFVSPEELGLFEQLVGVSGVGPKVALALLSALSPERLTLAIASGNVELLSSVSGVGKKTAAHLVLELKGRFEQIGLAISSPHEDLKAALASLGYSVAEATSAIAALPDSPDLALADKIKLALQHFARG